MSYVENVNTRRQDTGEGDAFGRLRVSEVNSQLDLKQLHDPLPLFYDTFTDGNATITHSEIEARSQLATTSASGIAIIQTKQRGNYSSGKSQQIFMTFNNFDQETNVTKRVGYFTHLSSAAGYDTSLDGLWLESTSDGISINVYKTGVESERTLQSNWNIDTLDGNGPSGVDFGDFSTNFIFLIDFEWLGLGRIRWGTVHQGNIIYFHESNFTNETGGVYMSTPNHPLRAEMRQSGAGSGTFNYVCATVGSEGAINKLGRILSDNLGTTHVNANATSNKYALLGIRLQSAKADTLVDLLDFSVLATTQDNQLVEVWLNPTVAGTFTYSNVTNSSVQTAKGAANGSNTVTGGTLLFSTYVSQQTATPFVIENTIRLGMNIDYTVDEIVLTTNPLTSNSRVLGAISWRELA